MNGIENAQFDLGDARCSLETAIELLESIGSDGQYDYDTNELTVLLISLREIKGELDQSYGRLDRLLQQIET